MLASRGPAARRDGFASQVHDGVAAVERLTPGPGLADVSDDPLEPAAFGVARAVPARHGAHLVTGLQQL